MRLLIVFLAVGFAACSPKNTQKSAPLAAFLTPKLQALAGPPFELAVLTVSGKEIPLPATRRPTMQFREDGGVSGLAGVNRYSTVAELDGKGGILWKGQPVATKMAGPAEAMVLEDRFLEALQAAGRITLEGGKLTLTSADGAYRMELRRP